MEGKIFDCIRGKKKTTFGTAGGRNFMDCLMGSDLGGEEVLLWCEAGVGM